MIPAPDPLPTAHRLAQGAVEHLRANAKTAQR